MTGYSYSSFSTALQCLQKYKLIYVDKLQGEESGDLAFGTAIHSTINAILEGEDGAVTFSVHWTALKDKEMTYGRFKWAALGEIGYNLIEKFTKYHAAKFKPVYMEQRFYAEYRGIKLEGTADFLGEYEGVPSLFDWKTTGYPYKAEKALVCLQLYLYAYLGIQAKGYVPKQIAYFPFVKSTGSIQRPIIIPFDEKAMYEHLDNMVDYIAKLEHGGGYPKQPNACIMGSMLCPFIQRCWGSNDPK